MKKFLALTRGLLQKYKDMPLPVKASLWFMVCSVIQKGISFITTPIFTRLMTEAQFGEFTLFCTWINIVCIFTTLNLQFGSFNTAQIKFGDNRKAYTSSIQTLVTVLTLVAIGLFMGLPTFWESILDMPILILVVMLIQIWSQFASGLWMANCRFDYRYKGMVAYILTTSLLGQVLGIICVLGAEDKGYARVLAVAAVEIIAGLGIYVYNLIRGKKLFVKEHWKFALGFNIPLIPYYLSQTIFAASDRIMISKLVGKDKAGIYGLAHNIAFLLTFVIAAIRNSYTPWYFRKIQSKEGMEVKKSSTQLMLAVGAMLLMFVFVAPELLLIMGGETYYEAVWIIPPLIAGLLFEFFTDGAVNILFYYEKKGMLILSTIGCAAVNIVLNFFGMRIWGYYVAGYTTLISYILFWLCLDMSATTVCRKQNLDAKNFLVSGRKFVIGGVFLILTGLCMLLYLNTYVRYSVLGLIFVVLVILRKKLMGMFKEILAKRK